MHKGGLAVTVCVSVTLVFCIETVKGINKQSYAGIPTWHSSFSIPHTAAKF